MAKPFSANAYIRSALGELTKAPVSSACSPSTSTPIPALCVGSPNSNDDLPMTPLSGGLDSRFAAVVDETLDSRHRRKLFRDSLVQAFKALAMHVTHGDALPHEITVAEYIRGGMSRVGEGPESFAEPAFNSALEAGLTALENGFEQIRTRRRRRRESSANDAEPRLSSSSFSSFSDGREPGNAATYFVE